MLGEPERTSYDLNFWLFGFPVRVHPLFWLVAVLLGARGADPPSIVIWVVALFIAILCHEFGHALAMRAFGFRPWIVLYGMGGLASYDPSSGRGRRMTPWRTIVVSFAGPLAGFLLAAAVIGTVFLAGTPDFGRPRVGQFIGDILYVCIFWGLVNLLPIYPLDGGHIARELFVMASPSRGLRGSLMLSFIAAVFVAAAGAMWLGAWFLAILFGYFAYGNYTMLQATGGRGRW